MVAMRAHITENDIHAWARAYLTALDHTGRLARRLPRQRRPLARRR
jgi:trehalose 6-phosphate synthase